MRDAGRAWVGAEADPPPAAKDDNLNEGGGDVGGAVDWRDD